MTDGDRIVAAGVPMEEEAGGMASLVRVLGAFALAWAVGVAALSITHTQFVIARVTDLGVAIPFDERVSWTLTDLRGLNDLTAPSELLPIIVLIALLVAFFVAAGLTRLFGGLRRAVFVTAGFSGILALFLLLETVLGLTPIAGARGNVGLLAHAMMGGLAGLVFASLTRRPRSIRRRRRPAQPV